MPTYALAETEEFNSQIVTEELFGINFVTTNDFEFTPQSTPVELLDGLGASNLRFPGGSVTEREFDMTDPNSAVAANDPNQQIMPMDDFFEMAGQIGVDVTLVIPTRVAFLDSAGKALEAGADAGSSGDYGSRDELAPGYLTNVQTYVQAAIDEATANGIEVSTLEIGNEFWGSGEMTAAEYGFLAGTLAKYLDPLFPDQKIIIQVVHSANEFSPNQDTTAYAEPLGNGDFQIRSLKYLDEKLGNIVPEDWIERTITGNGGARKQTKDIAREINKIVDAPLAFDGIVDHSYFEAGFGGVDSEREFVLDGQFASFLSIIDRPELTHSLTEWSPRELNEAGLQYASMITEVFFQLSSHGIDAANFWPLTFSINTSKNRTLIDTQENDYTFGGEAFRLLRESLVGTESVLDFEVADEIDVHGFSDENRFIAYVSERSGLDQLESAGQGITLNLGEFLSKDANYFMVSSHLGEDGSTGMSNAADPVRADSNGFSFETPEEDPYSVTFSMDAWSLMRIEFTEITANADVIDGRGGNDLISGVDGDDTLSGAAGNDTLNGGVGEDVISGGEGADVINGGLWNDTVDGGEGNDSILGDNGNDELSGGLGDDTLKGGNGADLLNGDEGNDSILGNNGNDELSGGIGNDTLRGEDDADLLNGDEGNDLVEGGNGNDTLNGGIGNDTLDGGVGEDVISGGEGADVINGGLWNDTVDGGAGNDSILGDNGNDELTGGLGEDTLSGGSGADSLDGGLWNDTLNGGSGNDTLKGNNGADRLNGGFGNDILEGGAGTDVFVFSTGGDIDTISDFSDDFDKIDLTTFTFVDTAAAMQTATQMGGDVEFDFGGGDRLIVSGTTLTAVEDDLLI